MAIIKIKNLYLNQAANTSQHSKLYNLFVLFN